MYIETNLLEHVEKILVKVPILLVTNVLCVRSEKIKNECPKIYVIILKIERFGPLKFLESF